MLYGKQSESVDLIHKIADSSRSVLDKIIDQYQIDAVAFIPHSIPRKKPFLKIYEKKLRLLLPTIELVKAYKGTVPVAQKTLSKLVDRIENARNTIVVKPLEIPYQNILLIDDAVGSIASLNEVAAKIKKRAPNINSVVGFAIVGSYKGFEVIREA